MNGLRFGLRLCWVDEKDSIGVRMLDPLRKLPRASLWIGPGLFLAIFLVLPIVTIFQEGLKAPTSDYGWQQALPVLWFTTWQAALSTGATLIVGIPGAYIFGRRSFPGKRILRTVTFIPFILPTLVAAAGMEAWLGPNGWMNAVLAWFGWSVTIPFHHTIGAILFANIFYNTAIVLRVVGDAWERLDPRWEEAGRILGANRLQIFTRIVLPILMPSILAASLLVFFFDFSSFGVILILGGPAFASMEVEIYQRAVHLLDLRAAAMLVGIQMVCTVALSAASAWLSTRAEARLGHQRALQIPKPFQTLLEKVGAAVFLALLSIILILPMVSPFLRSCTIWEVDHWAFTAKYYFALFVNQRGSAFFVPPVFAFRNSILVGLAAVVISLSMAVPAAIALARPIRLERWIEPIWMLPLGTSAVVIGLGMLLSFGKIWPALAVSPALLPVAHALIAFPFVLRSLRPAFASISMRMHEAAATLGATRWQIFRFVDIPLVIRAITSAAAFAFAISLGEFGATVLITRPDFPTLPVAIYRFLGQPGGLNYGQAMAVATILSFLCAATVGIMDRAGEANARIA
jgi:thiamine transport system permease protein